MSRDRRRCGRETRWRESEAEGVPLTITPPLDEHQLDAEESEIGRKGIELKVRAWMCRGAPRQWWVPTSPDDRIVGSGRQLHDIKDWVEASHWGREDQVVGLPCIRKKPLALEYPRLTCNFSGFILLPKCS